MEKNQIVHRHILKYKNTVDMLSKLVSIYSIVKKAEKDQILPFERDILVYYILFGFSRETKDTIKKELKKSDNSINTTNSNLRKKGFLVRHKTNFTMGHVSKELQSLVDSFLKDPKKLPHYIITFTK